MAAVLAVLTSDWSMQVPIIADEIYEHFVFPGETYVPIASLTSTVPVLSCSGLTKVLGVTCVTYTTYTYITYVHGDHFHGLVSLY